MTFLSGSQTMEQDLELIILTCDALFQGVDTILDPLGLFALQLDQQLAVEVDLVVRVPNPTLLRVHQDLHIIIHGLKTTPFDLQLVNRLEHSQQTVVQTIVGGSLQLVETPFGVLNVIDQAVPDVIQQQDSVVNTGGETIELFKVSVITL